MRAFGFVLMLGAGVFLGVLLTVAVLPDASLQDVFFGRGAALFDFSDTLNAMGRAFRGVMIGLLWAAFGLTVAALVSLVFGTFRRISR